MIGEAECYRRLASGTRLKRLAWVLWLLSTSCGYMERPGRAIGLWILLALVVVGVNATIGSPYIVWPINGGTEADFSLFSPRAGNVIPLLGSGLMVMTLGLVTYVWRRSHTRPLNVNLFRRALPSRQRGKRATKQHPEPDADTDAESE